jgi:hypothetical protein
LETTVALEDQSEPFIAQAFRRALDTSMQTAAAMGLASMWIAEAHVRADAVVLGVVATDEEDDDASPHDEEEMRT